ncbi:MAG: ISAzo13 family transposase [Bifidobacteriaceae bacterium]|jgi:transposase|nr:ISAzo13 family transposase [Bifidobacteriaceae bacterium]
MDAALVEGLAGVYEVAAPHLDERQRRVVLGAAAGRLGHGGVSALARATGVARNTIARGERDAAGEPAGRVRAAGAGRPRLADRDGGLEADLRGLLDPDTAGDPERFLLWTTLSTRALARRLGELGHKVSQSTVGRMLNAMGYSLQANQKTSLKSGHPDQDAQFRRIDRLVAARVGAGEPVVSVDTKKKELVGNYKNGGREWSPAGRPWLVEAHDFPSPDVPRALPHGVYDIAAGDGWVSVGTDHDTSEFAAATIGAWWREMGRARYPAARTLLICADGGGSNSARGWAWKFELAKLAAATGLEITVAHLPPGTSKWNKIEHRMFSFISMNWRAKPLVSHEVVVKLISSTTTAAGLTIRCQLDTRPYPTGAKYTDSAKAALPLVRDDFHGDWNYTITPPGNPES